MGLLDRAGAGSNVGQNVLFVINHAMIEDNATSSTNCSDFLELWPSMYIALARSLLEKGHQCHFVVSAFDKRGEMVRNQFEGASLNVTTIRRHACPSEELSSSFAKHEKESKGRDPSSSLHPSDLETGLDLERLTASEDKEIIFSFFENHFVDEAMRILMTCVNFRPTLIITGENALHLVVPAGLKYDAPVLLTETSGPLLPLSSKYKRSSPQWNKCHNTIYIHQKLKEKKQHELSNLLIKCLKLGKAFTMNEWRRVKYYVKKIYLTSELNFVQESSPRSSLRDVTSESEFCFDFLFRASSLQERNSGVFEAEEENTVEGDDLNDSVESAIVPAELESPDNAHRLRGNLSGFSLEQFLSYGAPVIGVWIDAQAIANQLGANTPHQMNQCIKEISQSILGALADLQYKGLILHYREGLGKGQSPDAIGINVLDNSSLLSHVDVIEFAEENIQEFTVHSPEEAVQLLSRCKAIVHSGTGSSIPAVSHLGIPSVILATPYFANGAIDYKSCQLALQEHHLAESLESLGTATVATTFGNLSRLVLATHIRKAVLDESMNLNAKDFACKLEAKDSLVDAVTKIEEIISTFCALSEGADGTGESLKLEAQVPTANFSFMSSDELQSHGIGSGSIKSTNHVYNLPFALRLEWTTRDGEEKFRFDSLKGHGQLA